MSEAIIVILAYYRVTIWRKSGKTLRGIRELGHTNVDFATNYFRLQAQKHVHNMVDIEAALLSNNSTAVRKYKAAQERRREQMRWPEEKDPFTSQSRKEQAKNSSKVPWSEYKKKDGI
ncbi:hypothetical protein EXU57_23015 [Segetibacter sp. 3557_3]|uniref:hypothetical protein n=1 Tax=Segetibacter sp. 3557_3 TaxID=2547429 RepID=UPI00105880AA|nr:hypothetical protein [Segetibacter sp. 3557_3]TDH18475.1 hypothetical protein EXU57_23015 [Segetibacter sp. 3557_3]